MDPARTSSIDLKVRALCTHAARQREQASPYAREAKSRRSQRRIVKVDNKTVLPGVQKLTDTGRIFHNMELHRPVKLLSDYGVHLTQKPDGMDTTWWNNYKTLKQWSEDLWTLDEIRKFPKRTDAQQADWFEQQLRTTTASRQEKKARGRKKAIKALPPAESEKVNDYAHKLLESLYYDLSSYPLWMNARERELLDQLTEFSNQVNQELISGTNRKLMETYPKAYRCVGQNTLYRTWITDIKRCYTTSQVAKLEARVRRLFGYSKLDKQHLHVKKKAETHLPIPAAPQPLTPEASEFFLTLNLKPTLK